MIGSEPAAGQLPRLRPRLQHPLRCDPTRGVCINVFMVAPKGPGHTVRAHYEQGRGVPSLVAVSLRIRLGRHTSDRTRLCEGHRCGPRGNHRDHASAKRPRPISSASRSVLCGGLTALMAAGYETLVEAGYSPEMAYFETIHEVKLIVDLIYEDGMSPTCVTRFRTLLSTATSHAVRGSSTRV